MRVVLWFVLALLYATPSWSIDFETEFRELVQSSRVARGNVFNLVPDGDRSLFNPRSEEYNFKLAEKINQSHDKQTIVDALNLLLINNQSQFDTVFTSQMLRVSFFLNLQDEFKDKIIKLHLAYLALKHSQLMYSPTSKAIDTVTLPPQMAERFVTSSMLADPKEATHLNAIYDFVAKSLIESLALTLPTDSSQIKLTKGSINTLATAFAILVGSKKQNLDYQLLAANIISRSDAADSNFSRLKTLKSLAAHYLYKTTLPLVNADTTAKLSVNERRELPTEVIAELRDVETKVWDTQVFNKTVRIPLELLLDNTINIQDTIYDDSKASNRIAQGQENERDLKNQKSHPKYKKNQQEQLRRLKEVYAGGAKEPDRVRGFADWLSKVNFFYDEPKELAYKTLRIRIDILEVLSHRYDKDDAKHSLRELFQHSDFEIRTYDPYTLRELVNHHIELNEYAAAYYLMLTKLKHIVENQNSRLKRTRYFHAFEDLLMEWVKVDMERSNNEKSSQHYLAMILLRKLQVVNSEIAEHLQKLNYSEQTIADALPRGEMPRVYFDQLGEIVDRIELTQMDKNHEDAYAFYARKAPVCSMFFKPPGLSPVK